jgi:hypothetical protein
MNAGLPGDIQAANALIFIVSGSLYLSSPGVPESDTSAEFDDYEVT